MTDLDQGDLNLWGDQIFLGGPKTPLHTMMVKKKKKNSSLDIFLSKQSWIFYLPYFLHTAPQNMLYCEIFNISLKD